MLSSDLNHDLIVNFKDFAVLADGWKITYDINDLNMMADEWLKSAGIYPDIIAVFDKDANNISGYVNVTGGEILETIEKVFLFIDGQLCSMMDASTEWPMVVNSACYVNGQHLFKVVGIDENYNIICGRTTTAIFNNEVNVVTMDRGYEIGKVYHLNAFGLPENDYIVEVKDGIDSNVVYSENFTGNIQAVIPSEAFDADHLIYDLKIVNNSNPSYLLVADVIAKKFKKEDYGSNSPMKMVVSVGSADLERECNDVVKAVVAAGRNKSDIHDVIYLTYSDSTWDDVNYCLHLPQVKIWIHFGHGNYGITSAFNQIIQFKDSTVSAYNSWRYPHSMTEFGFQQSHKLNFVFFHSCYGAHTTQFAQALGVLPKDDPELTGTRAFISWYGTALKADSFEYYNTYLTELWNQLQSNASLQDAKNNAEEGIRGGDLISENLLDYGVGVIGSGANEIYFRYPWINGSN